MSETDWSECFKLFSVTLIDRTREGGILMRRRTSDGTWQYRKMTPEEEADFISREAF